MIIAEDLRASILQAAIEGKLTAREAGDGTAGQLLAAIRKEKQKLLREKKIKKEKPLPPVTEEEKAFDIPDTWEWVRLGEIAKNISAGGDKPEGWTKEPTNKNKIPIYSNGAKDNGLFGYTEVAQIMEPSITVSGRGTIGFSCIRRTPYYPIVRLISVIPSEGINLEYLQIVFSSLFEEGVGTSIQQLTVPMILPKLIPLPPLAEQKRIAARVEALLAEVDSLAETEAALTRLRADFPRDMRAALLQAAIEGKLTEREAGDGTAAELLAVIRKEKQKLLREKKIKKEKSLPPVTEEEKPFDIPDTWEWVRLGDVCEYIQRGKSPKYSEVKKYPVIAQKCNQWKGFSIELAKFIEPETLGSYGEERFVQEGDLLWNSTGLGTLGRIVIYHERLNPYGIAVADSHVTVIRAMKRFILPDYLLAYFSGPEVQSVIEDKADGTTKQKELATTTIKEYLIPLPPLAEQKRIASRLAELLPLVDALDK